MTSLQGKRALVVGGGQTEGETTGNGRATALAFARQGAKVMVVDRVQERALATTNQIRQEGGEAFAHTADITSEPSVRELVETASEYLGGGIDILHNNVGVASSLGDTSVTDIEVSAFESITKINITGMMLTCKHVIPIMQRQGSGVILGIGSLASIMYHPYIAYQTSKVAVVSLMKNIAVTHARDGIRANAIIPGFMNTPMAIEPRVRTGTQARESVVASRDERVPLGRKQGTAWDVANAAVFLASDEASFITGVALPVDGGQSVFHS